jgi:hypothetical protein
MLDFATISNFGQSTIQLIASQAKTAYDVSSQYMGRAVVWINTNAPTVAQSAFDSSKKVVSFVTPYLATITNFAKSTAGTVASFASKNLTTIGIAGACAAGVAAIALIFNRFSKAKPAAKAEDVDQEATPRPLNAGLGGGAPNISLLSSAAAVDTPL